MLSRCEPSHNLLLREKKLSGVSSQGCFLLIFARGASLIMPESSRLPHQSTPNEAPEVDHKSATLARQQVGEHGLTRLDKCQDDGSIVADVVFVHGLQGHPCKTWQYEEPRTSILPVFSKKAPQKSVFWPRDLLADDIPNIRIFTYGYDSKISHYGSGPANQSNISQHGLSLLHAVSAKRRQCQDRYVLSRVIVMIHALLKSLVSLRSKQLVSSNCMNDAESFLLEDTSFCMYFGVNHLSITFHPYSPLAAEANQPFRQQTSAVNRYGLHE